MSPNPHQPLIIERICKGASSILNPTNILWHLNEHKWNQRGHSCASRVLLINLVHCIMISHMTRSCCICYQTIFQLYKLGVWLGGGFEVWGGNWTYSCMDLRWKTKWKDNKGFVSEWCRNYFTCMERKY